MQQCGRGFDPLTWLDRNLGHDPGLRRGQRDAVLRLAGSRNARDRRGRHAA